MLRVIWTNNHSQSRTRILRVIYILVRSAMQVGKSLKQVNRRTNAFVAWSQQMHIKNIIERSNCPKSGTGRSKALSMFESWTRYSIILSLTFHTQFRAKTNAITGDRKFNYISFCQKLKYSSLIDTWNPTKYRSSAAE